MFGQEVPSLKIVQRICFRPQITVSYSGYGLNIAEGHLIRSVSREHQLILFFKSKGKDFRLFKEKVVHIGFWDPKMYIVQYRERFHPQILHL